MDAAVNVRISSNRVSLIFIVPSHSDGMWPNAELSGAYRQARVGLVLDVAFLNKTPKHKGKTGSVTYPPYQATWARFIRFTLCCSGSSFEPTVACFVRLFFSVWLTNA